MRSVKLLLAGLPFLLVTAFSAEAAHAAEGMGLDGSQLGLLWGIPFVGILLSIAIFPLVLPSFWHHHFGKISAFWAILFLAPFAFQFGISLTIYEIFHVLLLEYIPFILLLLALFTVTGGIRIAGGFTGTPLFNTGILAFGTVIASIMGTTGAAMLLIHPLLKANEQRRFKVHTVVFFIFLVANIGGSLSPIGDPPLFLGFLQGVSFFWPLEHMFAPMLFASISLLIFYFIMESLLYRREGVTAKPAQETAKEPFAIKGKINILLLLVVIGSVLMSGMWKPGFGITIYGVHVDGQDLARDAILLVIAYLSWLLTDRKERELNGFTWFPIVEVAKLFIGIFLTMLPVIAMLRAGFDGPMGQIVHLVSTEEGPNNLMYFWITGMLSSFLDNAPTYLVFFNTAGGDAGELMGPLATTLLAISAGAVFMGANSYIGNAPNFMVRSVAESKGVKMPSFFGYFIWSGLILLPLFAVIGFIWFT